VKGKGIEMNKLIAQRAEKVLGEDRLAELFLSIIRLGELMEELPEFGTQKMIGEAYRHAKNDIDSKIEWAERELGLTTYDDTPLGQALAAMDKLSGGVWTEAEREEFRRTGIVPPLHRPKRSGKWGKQKKEGRVIPFRQA
jgi:hypothetical protein